jgi:pre-mRNA-splicing factor ISY1
MQMLNRWVEQQQMVDRGALNMQRRGRGPSDCRSVKEGEAARNQIVRELTSLISQIQNAGLGEQRIRDMNDEINRMLRLKYAWEMQIKKLGGPDYSIGGGRLGEAEGMEIPGQRGYRYFGAAKELPGVREMFELEAPAVETTRKTRKQLLKFIQPEYYGYRDHEETELLAEEAEAEREAVERLNEDRRLMSGRMDDFGLNLRIENFENFEKILLKKKKEFLLQHFLNDTPELPIEEPKQTVKRKYDSAEVRPEKEGSSNIEMIE